MTTNRPTTDTPAAREALLRRLAGRIQPVNAAVTCVGVLLAYLVGTYVTGPFHAASHWMGAMLACTSVVVVLQKPGLKQFRLQVFFHYIILTNLCQ